MKHFFLISVIIISMSVGFIIRDVIDGTNIFGWVIMKEIELDAGDFKKWQKLKIDINKD
ncbi:MAG TPA: hypothetical protein VMW66_06160 [Elusimicrobiales bacterium]|nr:hypothetical protein [Elusimicrobiales bacterium]